MTPLLPREQAARRGVVDIQTRNTRQGRGLTRPQSSGRG